MIKTTITKGSPKGKSYKPKKTFEEIHAHQSLLRTLGEKLSLFTLTIDDIERKANPTVDEIAWLAWANNRISNLRQEIRLESAV